MQCEGKQAFAKRVRVYARGPDQMGARIATTGLQQVRMVAQIPRIGPMVPPVIAQIGLGPGAGVVEQFVVQWLVVAGRVVGVAGWDPAAAWTATGMRMSGLAD
jgi:hypothetical protein